MWTSQLASAVSGGRSWEKFFDVLQIYCNILSNLKSSVEEWHPHMAFPPNFSCNFVFPSTCAPLKKKKKDEEEIGVPSSGLSNLFLQYMNYFLFIHPLNSLRA